MQSLPQHSPASLLVAIPPSWYDIVGISERANEGCEGLDESRDTILEIISKEIQEVPPENIVVGGFSQGGAVALYTALSLDFTPAGVLVVRVLFVVEVSTSRAPVLTSRI